MTVAGGVAGTVAPPAPGKLGQPLDPQPALVYLEALGRWRDDRRRELDQLDQAALASPQQDALTGDIMLSLALWKAASDRYELLLATWDSGRVGQAERERMSSLIWGRLDATLDQSLLARSTSSLPSGLAVSLPEACRLSDALAGQLRVRLALDPSGLEVAERLRTLRAQIERLRDQSDLEPPGAARDAAQRSTDQLAARTEELTGKVGRGGDIGGLLGPLEIEAAKFERDLIVNAANRRNARAKVERARELRDDLELREAALHTLVDQCVATVDPAPRYAVPDVDALGPVPNTAAALDSYLARLTQVSKAMTLAQRAYTDAVHQQQEILDRLDAYRAKAAALGVADDAEVSSIHRLASEFLARLPTRIPIAEQWVALYQSYLELAADQAGRQTTATNRPGGTR